MLESSALPLIDASEFQKLISFQWTVIDEKLSRFVKLTKTTNEAEMNIMIMNICNIDRFKQPNTKETYLKMEKIIKVMDLMMGNDIGKQCKCFVKAIEKQMAKPEARQTMQKIYDCFDTIRPDPAKYSVASLVPSPFLTKSQAKTDYDYLHKELSSLCSTYRDKFRFEVIHTPCVHVSVIIIDLELCYFPSFEFRIPTNYPTDDAILELNHALWTSTPVLSSIYNKFEPLILTKYGSKTIKAQLMAIYEIIKASITIDNFL